MANHSIGGSTEMGTEQQQRFIVIENTPGYLPEDDDPFITEDYDSAVAYMYELAESLAEFIAEGEGKPEISVGWASPNNYAAVMVYDHSREHDLGRYIGVEMYDDDDDDEKTFPTYRIETKVRQLDTSEFGND